MVGRALWNRRIEMRDGVELAADVILPEREGTWPAVVLRTPYMRTRAMKEPHSWMRLVTHQYAVVFVDVRGRGDSDGTFVPWESDAEDGFDTIEWVAAQDWCSGRVGMVGSSYEALTQWWAATAKPPHLRCIAPMAVGVTRTELSTRSPTEAPPSQYWLWWLNVVSGRTFQHTAAASWTPNWDHLPVSELAEVVGASRHWWPKFLGGEIEHLGPRYALTDEDWNSFHVPTLIGVGWWDDQGTMDNWMALQGSPARDQARLLIGAWDHQGNEEPREELGGLDVSASAIDNVEYVERFLAGHLKDPDESSHEAVSRCRVFRTGAMRWEELEDWPAAGAEPESWYLGDAESLLREPSEVEGSAAYEYDPAKPTQSFYELSDFAWSDPPLDERFLLRRADCLAYYSSALASPLDVSGQGWFEGAVSVDCPTTDLFVRLYDVHPDGRCLILGGVGDRGASVRLPVRNPSGQDPASPLTVAMSTTWLHHRFEPGHRIGLLVTSSWRPTFSRNLNTGEPWQDGVRQRVATVTVHHGERTPSRIVLPVESR